MNQQEGSYIDMKECLFILEDGYTDDATVDNVAGYAKGATAIVIADLTALTIIEPGVPVTFAGHTTVYYVTSTIETAGTTTTINISPALTTAIVDDEVITFGPHRLEIKIGEGNLTYTETVTREYKLNRGVIDRVRDGDQVPMEVQTTFAWTFISSVTGEDVPTVEEFIKREGPAAAYVTTGDSCDPYCVNIKVVNDSGSEGVCVDETHPVEVITFPKFYYESLAHDAKAGTVQMNGKCNALTAIKSRLTSWPG